MKADEIIQMMSRQGMRITEQRRTLAKIFTDEAGYHTPKEVYDTMEKQYPGLSFDTVYRNLRLMHDLGIIEQFIREEGVRFKLRCDSHHHHHHLICLDCEQTYPLEYCPMPELTELPHEFQAIKHKFEIYGYCRDCRESNESKQAQ